MIHTRDNPGVVPTFYHFYPKLWIVIQGSKKSAVLATNIPIKFDTTGDVPKMSVIYIKI